MKELFSHCFLVYNFSERRFELYDKRGNEDKNCSWDKLIIIFPVDSVEIPWTNYKYEIQEESDYDLIVDYDGQLQDYRD